MFELSECDERECIQIELNVKQRLPNAAWNSAVRLRAASPNRPASRISVPGATPVARDRHLVDVALGAAGGYARHFLEATMRRAARQRVGQSVIQRCRTRSRPLPRATNATSTSPVRRQGISDLPLFQSRESRLSSNAMYVSPLAFSRVKPR